MITRQMLAALDPLESAEIENLAYKKHAMKGLITVASPQALLARAAFVRDAQGRGGAESTAAHLELAAETISALLAYLPR